MVREIMPLCTGYISGDQDFFPAISWLIVNDNKYILIDTGMCDTTQAGRWHHEGSFQNRGMDIVSQLKERNVLPTKVEMIIFTHLHWDHCANLEAFTNALLIVSEDELRFALDPIPPYYRSYESVHLGLKPPFLDRRFRTIKGVVEVIPGITVVPTPGHSPGHISVMVKGEEVTYALAGDAVFSFDNLEPDWGAGLPVKPLSKYTDAEKMWNSLLMLARLGVKILPSHEKRVLQVPYYK